MSRIRILHISLFSISFLLTFSSYGGTAGLSKFISTDNIEWIASGRSLYKAGTCHFNKAATTTKNILQLRYFPFDLNVFLKATAILNFTRQKVQSNITDLTINTINTPILRLPYLHQEKDFYHYLPG